VAPFFILNRKAMTTDHQEEQQAKPEQLKVNTSWKKAKRRN
jgi:hypothetical protein